MPGITTRPAWEAPSTHSPTEQCPAASATRPGSWASALASPPLHRPARSSTSRPLPSVSLQPPRPGGGHGPRQPSVSNTKPGIRGGWGGDDRHRDRKTPGDLSDLTPGRQVSTPGSRGNTATWVRMLQTGAPDRLWAHMLPYNLIAPRKILEQTTTYSVYILCRCPYFKKSGHFINSSVLGCAGTAVAHVGRGFLAQDLSRWNLQGWASFGR